jgi:hypothetical protein
MSIRVTLGLSLLAIQIVMIVAARFHPMRYYCWAPYDSQNEYQIHALIDGHALSRAQVESRYRLQTPAINPRTIYQVTDIISYVERVYHEHDQAKVTVAYRTNGGPEREWHWPTP